MTDARPAPAGLLLGSRARPCGVCGSYRKLSKTHVPPQAAGNTAGVVRADMMTAPGVGLRPGNWHIGGMWVRGLCADCNNYAGAQYDSAYADFAKRMSSWISTRERISVPSAPAIPLAPGRVSRSVLSGMLGISPHIRVLHPTLATQVHDGGPVRLPGGIALRVAIYRGLGAQLTGPMLTGLTDGTSRAINTLAAVTFRPFSWALVNVDSDDVLAGRGWVDATDWLRYEDDREAHDLRWLAPRGIPEVASILHAPSDTSIQMYSKEIAPIMLGRLPS